MLAMMPPSVTRATVSSSALTSLTSLTSLTIAGLALRVLRTLPGVLNDDRATLTVLRIRRGRVLGAAFRTRIRRIRRIRCIRCIRWRVRRCRI